MDFVTVQLSILDPLYTLFGWLTRIFYGYFGNYGVAIIMLTVVVRGLLIPLNLSSQKSMIKMQALSSKTAELQRKYGDNKQKYQEELMKLQQENGAGGLSGCILPFLQLFLIWPIYRIVSGPLRYISLVPKENIATMIDMAKAAEITSSARAMTPEIHIGLIEILNNNVDFLKECIDKNLITMGQMVDLHFLGMDLTKVPSWNPLTIAKEPSVYVPLLLFPVLVVVINMLTMKLSTSLRPGYKEQEEAKKRAKNNPARAGQVAADDPTEASMKMMNWMMPIIMLITTFTLPAAMGLYWVVGGLMGILTQIIVYFLFTKPYEEKKKEMEEKKANAFKKKSSSDDEGKNKKNKKKK